MQTIQQKMAASAWQQVSAKTIGKEYKTVALRLPSLIHSCGLSQALSCVAAQKIDLFSDLQQVLEASGEDFHAEALSVRASKEPDLLTYLRLSRRALEAAGWIKRYVQALTKDEESGESS